MTQHVRGHERGVRAAAIIDKARVERLLIERRRLRVVGAPSNAGLFVEQAHHGPYPSEIGEMSVDHKIDARRVRRQRGQRVRSRVVDLLHEREGLRILVDGEVAEGILLVTGEAQGLARVVAVWLRRVMLTGGVVAEYAGPVSVHCRRGGRRGGQQREEREQGEHHRRARHAGEFRREEIHPLLSGEKARRVKPNLRG